MLRRILVISSIAGLLATPVAEGFAQATTNVPGLTATFVQPTGTGTSSSTFDVYIRLSLDASASSPFTFDGSDVADNFGLPVGFPDPTSGMLNSNPSVNEAFVGPYTDAFLNNGFECSDTFTTDCGTGPYQFTTNFNPPSLVGLNSLTIDPGDFMDFLFGTFAPDGGSAPPGVYTFFNAVAEVGFEGVDANGDQIFQYVELADTCENQDVDCAFTRTVTANVSSTPEPATFGLLGLGFGAIGLVQRRRRKR